MPGADDVRELVFVAHTGQASGAENVMLALVDLALERGYRVRVACPDGPLRDRLPAGVEHIGIAPLGLTGERGPRRLAAALVMLKNWIGAAWRLRKPLRDSDTRIIVNSTMALPALALARPHRRSAAWLVHDILASRRQYGAAWAGRAAVGHAIAVSETAAAPLRQRGFEVAVAFNGVRWPVEPAAVVERTPPVIGILGVVTSWKGHHVLLEAVAGLPGVRLEIAGRALPGDVDYLAELRERAERPDLAGRVEFLGQVDAMTTLRSWDAVISASVLPEAGQLVVLEAMSLGVPVIATDHGGYADDSVMVCVPADDSAALRAAIERVTGDPGLRSRLHEDGRARVAAAHDRARTLPRMLDALLDPSP
ncbi:glycosyltransferase family 4 protein [Nocardia alba]|uniref:Glycosyltransferase involved in cell wall biosynthesis n=1 Tax=Nocardia alba TaxID=225051 RepID=A0A4R1FR83_9NOCA|nr:glycosyltransferase family 4 protein [Nocardia alba]TCJ97233.1 glycosyltransferase involved in cell wall biosynthesis [Nocardia alba]